MRAAPLGSPIMAICSICNRALICSIFFLAAAFFSSEALLVRCFRLSTAARASFSLASAKAC
ncbi:hypothetical protein D3C81_2037390 [compost metagenome]